MAIRILDEDQPVNQPVPLGQFSEPRTIKILPEEPIPSPTQSRVKILDQDRKNILLELSKNVAYDLIDTPRRVLAFGKFIAKNPEDILKLPIQKFVNPELKTAYDELSEDEKRDVAQGAIDTAVSLIPGGKLVRAAVAPLKSELAKSVVKGIIVGTKAGALFPGQEPSATSRLESAVGGGLIGAGLSAAEGVLAARAAKGEVNIRRLASQTEGAASRLLGTQPVENVAGTLLPEQGRILFELADTFKKDPRVTATLLQLENIARTGTLQPKEIRPAITALGGKIDSGDLLVNPQSVRDVGVQLVTKGREFVASLKKVISEGTTGDKIIDQTLRDSLTQFKNVEDVFFRTRRQVGLTLREYQRALDEMGRIGLITKQLPEVTERLPIFKEFLKEVRNRSLTARDVSELGIDFWRRNIFPLLSFMRDMFTNAASFTSEAVQDIGEDIYKVASGESRELIKSRAIFRSLIRSGDERQLLRDQINEIAGSSAMGMNFRPFFSETADKLAFFPLNAKRSVDTAFRRLGALQSLYGDAMESAIGQGLKGGTKEDFIRNYVLNAPKEAIQRAFEKAGRLGFTRELTGLEESISGNRWFQLLVTPFPRWNFQFTRFLVEHTPFDTGFWRKALEGKATGSDLTRFVIRNVEGLGAINLFDKMVYDHVDFDLQQFVHEDGTRTSLLGLSPFSEILFFNALLRGDLDKMEKALYAASLWFAPLLDARDNGIIGGLVTAFRDATDNGLTDSGINRIERFAKGWVPGLGILRAMERIFDPVARRGLASDIPILSRRDEPVIGVTTGEPVQQLIRGLGFPGIGSIEFDKDYPDISVPFGKRPTTPLENEMRRLSVPTRRPTPGEILEFVKGERIPPEIRTKFEMIAGAYMKYYGNQLIESSYYKNLRRDEIGDAIRKDLLSQIRNNTLESARFEMDRGNADKIYQRIFKRLQRRETFKGEFQQ